MTLGEVIKIYRESHGLSVRQFARLCGLSNTYISTLEKGVTPRGDVPAPSIETYRACATAMGITADELVRQVDDYINLSVEQYSPAMQKIIDSLDGMNEDQINKLLKIIETAKDVL